MKLKKTLKLSLLACSIIAFSGCSSPETEIKEEDPIVFETGDIKSSGLAIQRLISGADSNNHPYQTFSYETVPVNSPYSDIDVTTAFVNGTSCSDYVTTQHDASNKTITLTCLQPFNTVIKLHLEAHYKSSVYADVSVRYLPKYSTILRNYLELYEEDTQNSGQYVERTVTAAYEDSFEFTVSTNTEGVVSNPRQPATVDSSTGLFIDQVSTVNGSTSDPSYNSQDEFINNSLNLTQMLEICPEYYTGNNFSSSFLQLMQNTGFDVILPKIMMRSFIHQTSVSTTRTNFSFHFRTDLFNYLISDRIDTDLRFDSTNTKVALINGINDWFSNNSVVYIPYYWLNLKCADGSSNGFDWNVNFANGDVESHDDLTDGEMPFYSSIKILMPSPYTVQELAPLIITVESSDIYF